MFPSEQAPGSRVKPHPPKEGKPKYQRQLHSKVKKDLYGEERDSTSEISSIRNLSTTSPFSGSARYSSRLTSSNSVSSLDGIGLHDELATSLPTISRQDSLLKYDPLPPIQFKPSPSEVDDSAEDKELPNTSQMGRRNPDSNSRIGSTKTKLKGGNPDEQDNGPTSAKRARPLYRKGKILKETKAELKNGETYESLETNVSPVQDHAHLTKTTKSGPKSKVADKHMLRLAFRLLDGERVESIFSSTNTINDVMTYLLKHAKPSNDRSARKYVLCSHEIPLREYHDLGQTLSEAGITDRMLLYLTDK